MIQFDFMQIALRAKDETEQFARFWKPAGNSFWLFAKSHTKRHDGIPFGYIWNTAGE